MPTADDVRRTLVLAKTTLSLDFTLDLTAVATLDVRIGALPPDVFAELVENGRRLDLLSERAQDELAAYLHNQVDTRSLTVGRGKAVVNLQPDRGEVRIQHHYEVRDDENFDESAEVILGGKRARLDHALRTLHGVLADDEYERIADRISSTTDRED